MKRGQAAFEFLMTYGWALLVTLVAIGALAFFGVLNPGQFLPNQCALFVGLTCVDINGASLTQSLKFNVQNGIGYNILFPDNSYGIDVLIDGFILAAKAPGASRDCTVATHGNIPGTITGISYGTAVTCNYLFITPLGASYPPGSTVKGSIVVTWQDAASQTRSRTGSFSIIVEK